jgi:hypothetical protein
MTQVVEHLPSKHEAQSSNPSTAKKKKSPFKNMKTFHGLDPLTALRAPFLTPSFLLRVPSSQDCRHVSIESIQYLFLHVYSYAHHNATRVILQLAFPNHQTEIFRITICRSALPFLLLRIPL